MILVIYQICVMAMHVDREYNCRGLPNLVTNDNIDPDDNFYNGLNVDTDSVYYTEDEFNEKIVTKVQAASTFSIIHFNARSMSANFNKLKSVLSSFDFTFT